MNQNFRFLLLQVRNADDPMAEHEVQCFSRSLRCSQDNIRVLDLLSGVPSKRELEEADVVLLGGSGNYSVARGGPWLPSALATMCTLYDTSKPTFASCWGFQAMAKALGGKVVTDYSLAEVGTLTLKLTPAGKQDPVFGPLGSDFQVHIGHEDIVIQLPQDAILLASSDRVPNEAFRFEGKPIYCTQFHPELNREGIITRILQYPEYLQITGYPSLEDFFSSHSRDTRSRSYLKAIYERSIREIALTICVGTP